MSYQNNLKKFKCKDLNFIKERRKEWNQNYYNKCKEKKKISNNFSEINTTNGDVNFDFNHNNDANDATQSILNNNDDSLEDNSNNERFYESSEDDEPYHESHSSDLEKDSDLDDDSNFNLETNAFLFSNSNIQLKELYMSLLGLKFKHKLSDLALDDFIKLIKIILPSPNNCAKTYKAITKYFNIEASSNEFSICPICKNVTQYEKNKKIDKLCSKCTDNEQIQFTVYDIKPQIENILSNKSYLNQIINSNKSRALTDLNKIESPLNGSLYRNLPLDKKNELTISLNVNSDGAPILKSKNFSIWPVFATIVELNQSSREKFQNILLLGVWLHGTKPVNDKFFQFTFEQIINANNVEINGKI